MEINGVSLLAFMTSMLISLTLTMDAPGTAHAKAWTQYVDWAATNREAGTSVDCPLDYKNLGVEYAIADGGRSDVIDEARLMANQGNIDRAYQLVLLTQCNNPTAQRQLQQAGASAVAGYLMQNWTLREVDRK